MSNKWTEKQIADLRAEVQKGMSQKRFLHTLAVEEMTDRLASLFGCEKREEMCVAAILHDITKECSVDEQLALCEKYGIPDGEHLRLAPKTFHAQTAAALVAGKFPEFADETVIGCVRWHTTGHAGMTLEEQLVYLADYIDMTRLFPDCVRLRNYFFDAEPQKMDNDERMLHLYKTLLMSYDMTIRALVDDGAIISADTVIARNEIAATLRKMQ
ncbi:MAG: HD domain-containing protein [Ruminococcaceae bacterium]|nr:HD domain-containing protein [Oscillospiraceae bacterium]